MGFVGQHVVFRTKDGTHHGILHSVTNDGILVRPVGSGTTRLAYGGIEDSDDIDILNNVSQGMDDVIEAFFPFLFFPFFALWWLRPWGWWW